ncbi:uncharacterized protein [Musca autumnalis]|uniref:uncharacterized protein n=1 Tax=Musca autumnalis TaxID=221902 RepID=UPI003CEBF19E
MSCSGVVVHLISIIYAKWESTPVIIGISTPIIIGISPYPILKILLPTVTVVNYTKDSKEYAVLKYLCYSETALNPHLEYSKEFKNNDLELSEFMTVTYDVNTLLLKSYHTLTGLKQGADIVAVDWNLETGYPMQLPSTYYPRPTYGTGISMGLILILNAEVDEYYCSSSSGAGFKVNHGSPVDRPIISEGDVTVRLSSETRFCIDTLLTESSPAIRSLNR